MTLKGVDISNWQNGINVEKLPINFMFCKATEGASYVDKKCDSYVNSAIKKGIKWGIYHFARENSAAKEAEFFYNNIKGYIGKGIPVLDYEVWGKNKNDISWCEQFIQKFYDLSSVWCMIYISASHCKDFANSWIPKKCGLWVAGYPTNYTTWPSDKMPYSVAPWPYCVVWQFTSSLRLAEFNGNLDGDYAYIDANTWDKYAKSTNSTNTPTQNEPNYDALADEVILGKWGNGNNRKTALNNMYGAGTYEKVQTIVNSKLQTPDYSKLATEVISGKWGNGWNRKNALNNTYGKGTYEKVQAIVNERMK